MIRPCDIRFITGSISSQRESPLCDLHHCSVHTEPFAETYRDIPGLRNLQGSVWSDIRAIHAALPGVDFSGMILPTELINRPQAEVLADLDRALEDDIHDLALWDIDPSCSPEKLGAFLRELALLIRRKGREPNFSFIPFTWEELDWEFPQYRRAESIS